MKTEQEIQEYIAKSKEALKMLPCKECGEGASGEVRTTSDGRYVAFVKCDGPHHNGTHPMAIAEGDSFRLALKRAVLLWNYNYGKVQP